MNSDKRKLLWCGLASALVLGMVWEFVPLADAQARLKTISTQGIGYSGRDVPLTDTEGEILREANVLRRLYDFDGQPFLLTIIDGTNDRHAVHDPLYCIRGAGWTVISENPFPMRRGSGRLVRMERDGVEAEALIWFSDGRRSHASPSQYWWQTTVRRLTLGMSGEEPVLVVAQSYDGNIVNWRRLVNEFPPLLHF